MPTLKSYSFTRINEFGASENCYVTFRAMSFDWEKPVFYAEFRNFESREEAGRNTLPRPSFNLKLEGTDLLLQLTQQIPAEDILLPFLEIFSNKIWDVALAVPFVPDYSTVEEGKRVRVLKSLSDLNATLTEVQI